MLPTHVDQRIAQYRDEIRDWRFEQLQRAGYGRHEALILSRRPEVDLHQAIDLVRRGCSPELALEILL
jgi:hypothetical protein